MYWKGWKQTFESGRTFSYVRVFLHFSDDGFYKYSPGDQVAAAGRSTIPTTLATVWGLEVEHVDSTSTGLFQEWFWGCERLEDNTYQPFLSSEVVLSYHESAAASDCHGFSVGGSVTGLHGALLYWTGTADLRVPRETKNTVPW